MPNRAAKSPPSSSRGCRTLVVEDDALTHTTLRRVIERSGHECESVGTMAEAYPRLRSFGCLVLDLQLPDGSGIELLRYVRERQLPLRVAVHTGCSDRTVLNEVRALRPDALFMKPFDPARLVAWLHAARDSAPALS